VTENVVLEILGAIQADLAGVKTDLTAVRTDVTMHTRTLSLLQQDTGMIRGALHGHTRMLEMLQQDTRMIRGAVNDMARTDVAAGEVEAIHHDLNRAQREIAELTARLELIEGRDRH